VAPAVSKLVEQLVHEYLPADAVRVVQGGVPETTAVLELPFDHITYTGSTQVGKIVMTAAAKNLTPCTLELGGKNPTFVDRSADLKKAVGRILIAKTCTAGQWCVNVDYVLVDELVMDEFAKQIVSTINKMVGDEARQRGDGIDVSRQWYNRIVSERHTQRLKSYLEEDHGGTVIVGGLEHVDVEQKFFPMTVVLNPKLGSKLMTEEIFGPILVLCTVADVNEAICTMKKIYSTPLALYIYSTDSQYTEKILTKCTSGSVGVNTSCEQLLANTVPFGGVGQSGFGAYHGKWGFDEFSHLRSILYRTNALPLMFLPDFMWSRANEFPEWVKTLMIRKSITGMVPTWVTNVGHVVAVGCLAFAVVYWRNK